MNHEALYDKLHARLSPFVRTLSDGNRAELETEWDGLLWRAGQEIEALRSENARTDQLEAKLGQAALETARLASERDALEDRLIELNEWRTSVKHACDWDERGNVCLIHSPAVQKLTAERDALLNADEHRVKTICRLTEQRDTAESLLTRATDLLNTWARESGVQEAASPSEIKDVVDRLWSALSVRQARQALGGEK